MQTTGHLIVKGEKILVLARPNFNKKNPYISFKIRLSGKDGVFFSGESKHLEQNSESFNKLKNGEVIYC